MLEDFCGNVTLWDLNLLVNNSWPEFTSCFQQTALVWGPCGFLWLSSLIYLPYLRHLTPAVRPQVTWLNGTKTFLSLGLCLLSIISLLKTVSLSDQRDVPMSQYVADAVKAATFMYAGILVYVERRQGLVTSGIQFIFWFLVTAAGVVPFYSSVIQKEYETDVFLFALFFVQYAFILLIFLLQFCSESAILTEYRPIGQEQVSPEVLASFPSRLTFWWAQSLVRTGFRKSLESSDLFTMSPENQSEHIVPPFQKAWAEEVQRVEAINARKPMESGKPVVYANGAFTPGKTGERTPLLNNLQHNTIPPPSSAPATGGSHRPLPVAKSSSEPAFHKQIQPGQSQGGRKSQGQVPQAKGQQNGQLNGAAGFSHPGQGQSQGQGRGGKGGRGAEVAGGRGGPGRDRFGPSGLIPEDDGKVHPSLFRVLVHTYWVPFMVGQVLMLLYTLLQFVNPMVLNALLSYVNARSSYPQWQGYVLACSFFVASFTNTFIYHQTQHNMLPLGMRIKSAIITAVYKKALTMSHESKRKSTVGEIVNLMSIDCQRVQDSTTSLYLVWSAPLTLVIALYQLWGILGPACLAGLGVMLLVVPVNVFVVSKIRRLQIANMRIKDQRLKLMAEVLNGIKVLKLYGWEPAFEEKVLFFRNKELDNLHKVAYLNACTTFVWTLVPYLVTLASFTAYILTSELGYLDSTKAFVSLSLFNLMRQPINMIPQMIPSLIQAAVSLKRVNTFLNWGDLNPNNVIFDPKAENVISIENGIFRWDKNIPKPTLKDISLAVPEGKLIAVVGPVGCGKSSLLSAITGEMEKLSGTVRVKNGIAYVPQEAWIQNATARDNILFGKNFSKRRYDQVVRACALEADFQILMGGDMTEIGEKGINLSGGQKQRVSLARAVYSEADTYLLDDPLSAVDSHVGKHIFQNVIGREGLLANKTRILVTHGVHWLPMVDQIVVLTEGTISEVGSYEQLLARNGAFATFLRTYLATERESHSDSDEENEDPEIEQLKKIIYQRLESMTSDGATTSGDEKREISSSVRKRKTKSRRMKRSLTESQKAADKTAASKQTVTKLVEAEQSMTGSVKLSVYLAYVKAIGSLAWCFVIFFYVLFQGSSLTANIWLSDWTDDSTLANVSLAGTPEYNALNAMYLGVYGGLGAAQAVSILSYSILYNTRMVRATGRMHAAMLSNVLKAPMLFFDTTPVGRIINRFARDVDVMDFNLPMSIRMSMQGIGNLLNTLILISYSSPIFLSVILPLGGLYKLVQVFYVSTSRQLKRLESTTRSPVYTHFTETIQGASSIRAYGVTERFVHESQRRVDSNLVCYFAYLVSGRWLGVRLEVLGNIITLAAAMFAIVNTSLSSGLVGLSVTYAMNVTQNLNFLVRVSSELESNIVCTERIKEYAENPTEAPWSNPDHKPADNWPQEGEVEFKDFQMRYRPGLDLVLKGITCHIKGGEKVGIVGRTGAGKSSLTVALFRLAESAAGTIVIDKEVVGQLGLHDLRRRLTILPQDPIIFSGTLRMNLDPTGRHSDDELWNALKLAHLHNFVADLPAKLDYECGEGGMNLSVGQRQLICLARSVLRKSKILVLDEATAAVDMETDDVIQQTIRSEFKDSTVLTIAHRLNTIMDYDRIMVMEEGRIKEFDSPQNLLADTNSAFYGMAKAANLA